MFSIPEDFPAFVIHQRSVTLRWVYLCTRVYFSRRVADTRSAAATCAYWVAYLQFDVVHKLHKLDKIILAHAECG